MSEVALRLVQKENMDKNKALDAALSQIEKAFGKGAIMRLGQSDTAVETEAVSTGSLGLNRPRHRRTAARPSHRDLRAGGSGKTTLALQAIAEAQKPGGPRLHRRRARPRPDYAKKLGVDVEKLLISQPDAGEQALEIADTLVRSGAIDVVVIDSVAALVPRAEIEGEMGDSPGLQARLMSQALRKLTGSISRPMPRHLHQPNPHEDRRHVRQPGDHHGRQRAQVLRLSAARHPPHRRHQGRRGRRQPDPGEGGQEQGRAPFRRSSSTSCTARASPRPASSSTWASRPHRREAGPGSPTTASASARAARTPRS